MAKNNLLYKALSSGCVNLDDTTLENCILRVVDCDKTDGSLLLTDCDKLWNCNLCQTDPPYWMPWVDGMTFQLQTQFVNTVDTEPETPSAGWGAYITAELLDLNFNVIEGSYLNISSRYLAGWDGDSSYQVIEIDTSLPAFDSLDCFIIRINARDSTGTVYRSLCTHHFERLKPCEETILIEGKYDLFDCFGNYYALPPEGASVGSDRFAYSNARYYRGIVKDYRDSFEKTIVGGRVTKVLQKSAYRIVFHDLLAPYASRILTRQLLPASSVLVDSIAYSIPSFTMDDQADERNYFYYVVDMEQTCENDLRCLPAGAQTEPPILPPTGDACIDCIEVTCFG